MKLKEEKTVYTLGKIELKEKTFEVNGRELKRVALTLGRDAVLIIPIDDNNDFHLVKQKRVDNQDFVIEFPSGGIEEGEDVLTAAKRELSEELGLYGVLEEIGSFKPFANLVDLKVSVVLAKNVVKQRSEDKLPSDDYENIISVVLNESEIYKLISEKVINMSYTLSALSLLKAYEAVEKHAKK